MFVKISDLSKIRKKYKNKVIVFAGGVFDVFHTAHIRSFKKLREYGDVVVIGIVSDQRVRERKGPGRPVLSQDNRAEIVESIKFVDFVVKMKNPTKQKIGRPTMEILNKLRPNIFVSVDRGWISYKKELKEMGIILKPVSRIQKISTSKVISKILKTQSL
jgi:cytidyltransferase-like protein